MRRLVLLPPVNPEEWQESSRCPQAKSGGRNFRMHGVVVKPVRDTICTAVTARRHNCLHCHRSFEVSQRARHEIGLRRLSAALEQLVHGSGQT